jgi:hypothetical protein
METNKIRRGLVEAFGFNRDLSDTFLLYLIRAKGYRVTKDGQIVPEVSYGSLDGLTLEQGERLSPVEWVQSKDLAKNLWQIRPAAEELTIAAQDSLWRQINSAASTAQSALNDLQKKMNSALQILAIAADQSLRLTLVLSAIDFTSLAMRSDLDGYEGLRSLLNWTPTQASLKREQVLNQITRRTQTVETLDLLQSDTLNRVITLAKNGQAGAIEALVGLRKTLIETDETAELASHLTSWKKLANKVIDEAINKEIKDIKKISDSNRKFKITSAQFVASSQTVELDQKQVKAWIQELLGNDAYQSVSGEAEIVLKIMLEPNA